MSDITKEPYAAWLEDALREMVAMRPSTIGIITIMPDGSTGTRYFNAVNRDRLIMCESIGIDYLEELIRANAEGIRQIIDGEEDEQDD